MISTKTLAGFSDEEIVGVLERLKKARAELDADTQALKAEQARRQQRKQEYITEDEILANQAVAAVRKCLADRGYLHGEYEDLTIGILLEAAFETLDDSPLPAVRASIIRTFRIIYKHRQEQRASSLWQQFIPSLPDNQ